MIYTIVGNMDKLIDPGIKVDGATLQEKNYLVLTLRRPVNVDEEQFLVKNAKAVVTDSRGITEVTTVMGGHNSKY